MVTARLETTELGATGIHVSRFAAGGHFTNGPLAHEDIPRRVRELNHLLDLGVTYFDVQWEPEEVATAEVMKSRKDEFAVAWPLHGVTMREGDVTEQYILDYCDDHRKRFGIEHVDILLWVALELHEQTQDRVMDNVRSAVSKLKSQGFCDHFAFSCHHSPEMALHAVRQFGADFDVMMVPYSPLHPAAGNDLLAAAREEGVGTVGMKPFGGGGGFPNMVWSGEVEHPDTDCWRGSSRPYEAAIRWVIRDSNLDCTVPGAHSMQQIDELHNAVAEPFNAEDEYILEAMNRAMVDTGAKCQLRSGTGQPGAWD